MSNNEIYKSLRNDAYAFLEQFKLPDILRKFKETQFSNNVLYHSKRLAYNYSPFYCEHTGYSLDHLISGMPKSIKNKYIYYGDRNIEKIEHYGKHDNLYKTDFIIMSDDFSEVLSLDNFDDFIRYIKIIYKNQKAIREIMVNDENDISVTRYFYKDNKIVNSLSFSITENLRVELECENIYEYKNNEIIAIHTQDGEYIYRKD
ncbi:hypothetical protein [Pasteurella sp. PK-2025]|uniref:hypothetical protein n=1 Tax=Pasteurella sp. PK-2025 TaxID=3413133 RepID=UPI003C72863A